MFSQDTTIEQDSVVTSIRNFAQNILAVIFGIIPLLLIPTAAAPFEYTKVCIVLVGVFLALILWGLATLREGVVRVHFSYALGALWLTALVALVSGLLSGDRTDSLIGDLFSIHAAAFVGLLALIPSVWLLLRVEKKQTMRMYILLGASTIVLVCFHVIRIFFGAQMLSFGLLTSNTATPVGSWNDLGLFLGLVVLLSLVALEQLTLTKIGKGFFWIITIGGLFMLAIINFFTIWLVLGLASLAIIVFTLGRDPTSSQLPLIESAPKKARGSAALWQALLVFFVSILFVIAGPTFGGWINSLTGINYVEVRPSFGATMDIARSVYHENALLGIGTNRFADAWRMYKNDSINSTVFWNTDFNAGNGYLTTFFVTTGLLGGSVWLLFLLTYAVTGIRRLLSPIKNNDRTWYFIALSSFLSALYVWGISVVYVPGVTILLLGALCTGVSLHAFNVLTREGGFVRSVVGNRRGRFVLTLGAVILIVASVGILYLVSRHYSAVYGFNTSVQEMQAGGTDVDAQEAKVASAFQLFASDTFARRVAEYQLAKMNALVGVEKPTQADQQNFSNAVALGINAVQVAIQNDPNEPANWSLLGNIYAVLAGLKVDGAYDHAIETLTHTQTLNPKNPLPYLDLAIVEARAGKTDDARKYINQAIKIKPNFVDAFFLLSQIEIASGNVDAAIQSTEATITLDPNNPTRYYQLGLLARSKDDTQQALAALERAVSLDENFANARYHLALVYDELGRSADAKAQLEVVLKLNPGNQDVTQMLDVLNREGSLKSLRTEASQKVDEQMPVTAEDGTVNAGSGEANGSSLVTPVNTPPKDPGANTPKGETQDSTKSE